MLVDTFTIRLPPRAIAAIDAFWDLVYGAVASLLGWRLAVGAVDAINSQTSTMVLGLPVGWAIMACAAMAGLLALASLVTAAARFGPEALTGTSAAIVGFAVMLLLMAMRHADRPVAAVRGRRRHTWLGGWPVFLNYIKTTPYHDFSNYTLSVIPTLHPDGGAGREVEPVDVPVPRRVEPGRPPARRVGDGTDQVS